MIIVIGLSNWSWDETYFRRIIRTKKHSSTNPQWQLGFNVEERWSHKLYTLHFYVRDYDVLRVVISSEICQDEINWRNCIGIVGILYIDKFDSVQMWI